MNQPHKSAAFISPSPLFCRRWKSGTSLSTSRRCVRRRMTARPPCMMAKYEERDTPEKPSEETPIDKFIPPVQLPTLSTLSGDGVVEGKEEEIDLSVLKKPDEARKVVQMGAALTSEEEFKLFQFLKEVFEELKTIEWPAMDRVFKILVIVIISIVGSAVAIYLVDGLFYSLSQYLFETGA